MGGKKGMQNRLTHGKSYTNEYSMLGHARQRSVARGYVCDLEISDIVIPKICPLLEIPIFHGQGKHGPNSPSLDRIDNDKGYTKDNVWVISRKANTMKNNATFEEFETMCFNWKRLDSLSKTTDE